MSLKIPYASQMVLFTRLTHLFLGLVFFSLLFFPRFLRCQAVFMRQGLSGLKKSASHWGKNSGVLSFPKVFEQKLPSPAFVFCEFPTYLVFIGAVPLYAFYDDH